MQEELAWPAQQPELGDGQIVLRPWRSDDADAVYEACQDEQIQRYTTVPVPYRREDAVHFVEVVGPGKYQTRAGAGFAVTDRSSRQLLGACGLVTIDVDTQVGYAGYWVAPWSRGRKVACRALGVLTDWTLVQLGLPAVRLEIEPKNLASLATARLAGFVRVAGRSVQQTHRGQQREFDVFERTTPVREPSPALNPTDATLATYQSAADMYCAASPAEVARGVAPLLDALVARLPERSRVLEIGTGPGREAAYLERQGLVVDRTDATPAFLDRLRSQGHSARHLDVRDGELGGPYDAVLANAVLLHLDRPQVEAALLACHQATRPGGLMAITLKEGDGEAWSDAKLGQPRWFVYWREQPLRDALTGSGWRVLSVDHVSGRVEPWLTVLCER
ncbi:MAG: hypothetical protein NVS3B26_19700 [Mycobacteriales bacterium]